MALAASRRDRRHRVHRRACTPARRGWPAPRLVGVAASSPERRRRPRPAARRRARVRRRPRSSSRRPDVDVVHICTPNHLHAAARRGRAGRRQARRSARSRSRSTPRGAQRLVDAAAAAGPRRRRAVRLPLLPDGARGARARRARARRGAVRLHPRHLPAGLAAARRGRQLARRRRARRRLARVRRHRLALVRPGRVRLRPPDHPALRAHADRGARAHARRGRRGLRARRRRRRAARRSRPRTPRSCSSRPTAARSARSSISQISPGRKNRLWLELDGAEEALAFDQEEPESLWVGRREARHARPRAIPATLSPPAARLRDAARRPPAGLRGLLRRSSSPTSTRRSRRRGRPTGCRAFADGLRAAQITDAVLRSAREERWVDVGAGAPEVAPREARVPHRLHARAQPRGHRRLGRRATASRRSSSRRGRSSATGRSPRATSRRTRFDEAEADRVRARARRARARRSRRSPTTTTTCTPTRPSARRSTPTCARCIDAAAALGGVARRHVHRPRPGPQRGREPARGRAGLPAARRLRRRARREADDRELRDGGLAPRRLPRQPRLLARAVGVDVRARPLPQLRPVAPALARASTRSRR